ncbi:uncharacterized protein PRCAT00005427001 [Priceomyces carsonii]|uniref:uncharacterized protein n=1 Tax=Priceomyces carsonii TaxID=28549 RepID=UPI002EDB598F|nr:unnamed protein product [Priceomyces carsonii]
MDIHRCRFVDYSPHTITAVSFSKKSSLEQIKTSDLRLAVGRSNGDIEIWNPKFNWVHELTLPGSRGRSIEGLCWAHGNDGFPRLFSIGGSTYITEWDLSTCEPIANYDCNAGVIWTIDVNESADKLCVGCDDGSVVIVDISGGYGSLEHEHICQRQDSRVLSAKWFGNEQIVGGCSDARIRCWSANGETKGRILGTMRVDKSKSESTLVWSITVLPKRRQIVSGDSTGSVKFWDINYYTLTQSFKVHEADVLSLVSDLNEERIFSAGVDRKIHQFSLIQNLKGSKWIHNFSRLLHSNDVRSMAIYESKSYNFLISGGVEKSIVIQSLLNFQDGKYRKIIVPQQKSNILVNKSKRIIVLWQDQTVKIWKLSDGKHRLISKLTLKDDDNITSVDINRSGNCLAVATLSSVKIFHLKEKNELKLQVSKIRDDEFNSSIDGAKKVKLFSDNQLMVLTSNEDFYTFKIEENHVLFKNKIELSSEKKSFIPYANNINNLTISPDETTITISRFNGTVEVISLADGSVFPLTRLSTCPHLIHYSENDKILVLSEDNKLYEFFIKQDLKNSLLTPWSKRNSEFLPKLFLSLEEKPEGIIVLNNRVWIYGTNWISFFDLSTNIPINKSFQNLSSKKRKRDSLTIIDNEDVDFDGEADEEEENAEILELSLKQSHVDKLRRQIQDNEEEASDDEKRPYWLTQKYKYILKVDLLSSSEIIVIERPQFPISSSPAYDLPKLRI